MKKIVESTLFLGKNIIDLEEIPSTNTYMLENVSNLNEGDIVISVFQSKGRGQESSSWESNPGENLTFSLLLKPKFVPPHQQFALSKMISISILETLNQIGVKNVSIKWPNDIYVGDRKMVGILIENQISAKEVSNSVIGIGLNVNQVRFSVPNAVSIANVIGLESDLFNVLSLLISKIEKNYVKLRRLNDFDQVYLGHLYQRNLLANYEDLNGVPFKGLIEGVNEIGQLQVRVDGDVRSYNNKEIRFLNF